MERTGNLTGKSPECQHSMAIAVSTLAKSAFRDVRHRLNVPTQNSWGSVLIGRSEHTYEPGDLGSY